MGESTWIVVPAFNEESQIAGVISDLRGHGYNQIVVIDDGSRDSTARVAEEAGATVLRHVVNRGQGAALKTGIDFALAQDASFIVTFDSDGQHQAEEISALLAPLQNSSYDIALGSRFIARDGGHIPISRRILLKGSVFVLWLFYGVKMTDAHNGFRAMTFEAASKIDIKSNRMEHASEIVQQIKQKSLRYVEVPVTVRYNDPRHMQGHGSYTGALRIFLKMVLQKLMK